MFILDCSNTKNRTENTISFLRIPTRNPNLLKQWVENCGDKNQNDNKCTNKYVCELHFHKTSIRDQKRAFPKVPRRISYLKSATFLKSNDGLESIPSLNSETKIQFENLLLIAHYYALRCACRHTTSMKSVAVKISTALLRYTDVIPADKAYYEAGKDLKEEGRLSEAFVFPNHYLDLCEAIEEGEGQLVDHSDLIQTDFPSNIPLPSRLYLAENQKEHDNIKEWVLAVSMDQKVDQVLPMDDRQLYESCLQPGELPCLVTGYAIRKHAVSFTKSKFQASKDAWSKLNMASKIAPESNIPSVLSFVTKWCGNPQ